MPESTASTYRIGCLWLPHFLAQVWQQREPELKARPLIIGGTPSEPRRTVCDLSPRAAAQGVRMGMTLREAQAHCPDAAFRPPDDPAIQQAQQHLLSCLEQFSPDIEDVRPGVALFSIQGLETHYPSEDNLARTVLASVQDAVQLPARLGIASTRFCARVASAYGQPACAIPPGGERAFLAPLPVSHLPGLTTWHWQLRFLGITTIGAFAALPYADVLVRYGADAAQAHLLARGLDPTLLQPRQLGDPPLAEQLFEPPESRLEPLVFAIKRHLDRLCGELQVGGWICGSLTIRCTCDEGDTLVETCRPAEPTANAARLTDLLRWRLEQRQTEALQTGASLFASGLTKLTIQLDDLSPSQAQAVSLFTAERSGKRNVIAAVERLEALLGPEAVRTAVLTKGRRPDQAFTWAPFRPTFTDPARQRVPRRLPARKQPIASTRVQPLPLDTIPDGRASLLDGGGATHAVPAMRILEPPHQVKVQQRDTTIASLSAGRGVEAVARVSGPWKVAEQWWAQAGERDYFQVWTRLGRLYLLYREAENWFVQGVFD